MTRVDAPAVSLERALRYALVAPLIEQAPLWVDLGCAGTVEAAATMDRTADRILFVDDARKRLDAAVDAFASADALQADLATEEGNASVLPAIDTPDAVVTCFETLALVENFVPCVELLLEVSQHSTVILAVPNDASLPDEARGHPTIWGPGAVAELRRVLPSNTIVMRQVSLVGSALLTDEPLAMARVRSTSAKSEPSPAHFLLAFGSRASELTRPEPLVEVADLEGQRRVRSERDSALTVLEARIGALELASHESPSSERTSE